MSGAGGSGLSDETAWRPRVSFTPGSITKVVRARRRYVCGNHLLGVEQHHIEPGQNYARNSLPPHNSEVGNDRWWWLRLCLDCCPAKHDPRTRPGKPSPTPDADA